MGKFDALKEAIKGRLQYRREGYSTPLEEYALDEVRETYAHCNGAVYGTKSAIVGTNTFYPYNYMGENAEMYVTPLFPFNRENWKFMYRLKRINANIPGKYPDLRDLMANQLDIRKEVVKTSDWMKANTWHYTLDMWNCHLSSARYGYTEGHNAYLSTFCCP